MIILAWDNLTVHTHAVLQVFTGSRPWLRVFRSRHVPSAITPWKALGPCSSAGFLANFAAASPAHVLLAVRHGLKKSGMGRDRPDSRSSRARHHDLKISMYKHL
jgi:hypothetical protein